jgi:hypothetical protein
MVERIRDTVDLLTTNPISDGRDGSMAPARTGHFVPRSPDFVSSEGVFARLEDLSAPRFPSVAFDSLLFERSEGENEPPEASFERCFLPSGRHSLSFASSEGPFVWHSLERTSSEEGGLSSEGLSG